MNEDPIKVAKRKGYLSRVGCTQRATMIHTNLPMLNQKITLSFDVPAPKQSQVQWIKGQATIQTYVRKPDVSLWPLKSLQMPQTRLNVHGTNQYRQNHHYGKVFSEIKAQRFLKSRQWDHAIDLKPDAPETLDSKMYPLPVGQQEALDEFLQEHLKKGYIRVSQSPYAAPFFFVKKKDDKLRPVQDYRKLNEYTIKNKYPIPLIKELIKQLVGKH